MSKKRKARRATKSRRHTFATNPATAPRRRRRRHHAGAKFHTNPSRRRKSYRRNPGDSPKDIAILVGSGLIASILVPKLLSKVGNPLDTKITMAKNVGMIVAGAAIAYLGHKKNALVGVGMGLVVAGASRAILNVVPQLAGDNEFNGDEQSAILQHMAGSSELSGPMDGDELSGPMDGDDFLNGPMNGDEYAGELDGNEFLGDLNTSTL